MIKTGLPVNKNVLSILSYYAEMAEWASLSLQNLAVSRYHHHLQHPGHTRLKEMLHTAMYWRNEKFYPITCQKLPNMSSKQATQAKVWMLPTKLVITKF